MLLPYFYFYFWKSTSLSLSLSEKEKHFQLSSNFMQHSVYLWLEKHLIMGLLHNEYWVKSAEHGISFSNAVAGVSPAGIGTLPADRRVIIILLLNKNPAASRILHDFNRIVRVFIVIPSGRSESQEDGHQHENLFNLIQLCNRWI